ncbi:hypothetical protein V2J09_019715 [Rumex salicifolius]
MGSDEDQSAGCNTGLSLGFTNKKNLDQTTCKAVPNAALKFDHVYPALSLGPTDQGFSMSPGSSSTYSNNNNYSNPMKRSLDQADDVEVEVDKVSSRVSDEDDDEASPRKKLRLTKDQAAVLEDSFKEHSTLNPQQKLALAKRLNLRPRQVEVWFQNRRARTKLKQTEMDCEVLKKCCDTLTEENKRLQKELQELKSLKLGSPATAVYMHMPSPTLSMCPSCERFVTTNAATSPPSRHHGGPPNTATAFTKPPQFFTHPSAACL